VAYPYFNVNGTAIFCHTLQSISSSVSPKIHQSGTLNKK
jgi:hypothetical protein